LAILSTAMRVRALHGLGLAPGLLLATGLLAFGCGRTGLYELETAGNGGSGSSSGVDTLGCSTGDGTPMALATEPNQVMGLAVDATNVYWLDSQGSVMKVSKCGGTPTTIATAGTAYGSSGGGFGLAVDATRAYWADDPGDLLAVPLAGGTPTTLDSNAWNVLGLTLSGSDLYWVTPSVVASLPIQGGAPVTLGTPSAIAQGPPVVDDTNIYWVGNGVFSMPRAGASVTRLAASGPSTGLAIDDANVYWCANSLEHEPIMSTPKTGGPSVTLASDQLGANGFAADGQNVYWTLPVFGAVMKVPIAGGTPITVASAPSPTAIALDDTSIYWAQFYGTPTTTGNTATVMRLRPK
jgi:hypothetical protein